MIGKWDLATAAQAVEGSLHGSNRPFARVVSDTRHSCYEAIFVALTGKQFNGHDFLTQAVAQGALGALVSQEITSTIAYIKVADTVRALGLLGSCNRRRSQAWIAGVTGSNGKTTTTGMLKSVLNAAYGDKPVHATLQNHNNEIGVAQTLLGIKAHHQAVVVEMGARNPGDIAWLATIAQPTTSIITNIGHSHLALLTSLNAVAEEKSALVRPHPAGAPAYAIAPHQAAIQYQLFDRADTHTQCLTFGLRDEGASAGLYDIDLCPESASARLTLPQHGNRKQHNIHIRLRTGGMHQLHNAAATALAAWVNDIPTASIEQGLHSFTPLSLRQHITHYPGLTLINDCYNANPDSMRAALSHLALYTNTHTIAVLGDMLELGTHSRHLHQQIGEAAASLTIDALFTVGDNAEACGATFYQHTQHHWEHCCDNDTLATQLRQYLTQVKQPVALLIKGSRGMHMEGIAAAIIAPLAPVSTEG